MDARFARVIDTLHHSFERLMAQSPSPPLQLPRSAPTSGIYVFTEGDRHMYVGRSKRIRKRLGNHCRPSASHRMAAFAFKLAREDTGRLKATYKTEGSRGKLMEDPIFAEAFDAAKARIRRMEVRTVDEGSPINQAILEVYVSVVLATPYNDFDTH